MTISSAFWLIGLSAIVVLCQSASIAFSAGDPKPATTQLSPSPELSPKAVAKIIVDALGKNDWKDSGIRTTWKFTSPQNQTVTGPIEKFIPMVKSAAYQPMLNHSAVQMRELTIKGDTAAELAVITDSNGEKAYFIFQMRKQSEGDLKDCWLTDGVMRVQPGDAGDGAGKPARPLPDGQFPA